MWVVTPVKPVTRRATSQNKGRIVYDVFGSVVIILNFIFSIDFDTIFEKNFSADFFVANIYKLLSLPGTMIPEALSSFVNKNRGSGNGGNNNNVIR